MIGTLGTRLVVLRGNSASGKTAIAHELRRRLPGSRIAIVSQDVLRRGVLLEHPEPGAPNIGLIDLVTRYALNHGYHVVLEGILHAPTYDEMLRALVNDHAGLTRCYYLDVPLEETLRRHATKPTAREYGEIEMRSWYHPNDRLEFLCETVIPAKSSLDNSVDLVLRESFPADALHRPVDASRQPHASKSEP
jgi:hypothetical protein